MEHIVIYITVSSPEEGETIAAALIDKRLVACANILAPHTALYRWQGKTERAQEHAVIMKTRASLFERAREEIAALHRYECPCIVSWPIERGHAPYLQWIGDETEE